MAYWSLTHDKLATTVKSRLRLSSTTPAQNVQITQGINEALVELWNLLHPHGPSWARTELTITTVAGTRYADVAAGYRALDVDSLRIAAQDRWLHWLPTLPETRRPDPGDTEQGVPSSFTIGADPDDRDAMRVYFHPIPNAVYTVAAEGIALPTVVAANGTLTDVPETLHPLVADMATRDCAKNLGMYEAANYWNAISRNSQTRDLPASDPQFGRPQSMRLPTLSVARRDYQDYAP